MSMSDKELQDAFKQNQHVHSAPSALKQSVMQHHMANKAQQQSGVSHAVELLVTWFHSSSVRFAALAVAMVALFGVYGAGKWQMANFSSYDARNNPDITTVSIVNYHGYDAEAERFKTDYFNTERDNADKRRAKFNTYTDNYFSSQALAQAVSVQNATLYANNGSWTLLNCNKESVVISESIVAKLSIANRISSDIAVGTSVALAFDSQGRITSIRSTPRALMC